MVKIWIGNIDSKLTEYQLLKIAEQFGPISSYDFLYNINDKGRRCPRGYAFITYENSKSAADAVRELHKRKIMSKELMVRYASSKQDPVQKIGHTSVPAALRAGTKDELTETEKEKKIRLLEAKLRLLEGQPEQEFRLEPDCSPKKKPR